MSEKKNLILAVGNFDGVHLGHRRLLNQLVREGGLRGLVPAVLTFPEHPLSLIAPEKAPSRLMDVNRRCSVLRENGVGEVILLDFNEDIRRLTAREFIELVRDRYGVKALLMGFNNRIGSDRLDGFEEYRRIGSECGVEVIKADDGLRSECGDGNEFVSSTAIRRALERGDVTAAASMLGSNYVLSGTVVTGRHLGTGIGFPTANLSPSDPGQMLPADGVYAADVVIGDEATSRRAVVNIGTRPTVQGHHRTIEAHIIGFKGDIYGKEIAISFVRRLRDEQRFPSIDDLVAQIKADIAAAGK